MKKTLHEEPNSGGNTTRCNSSANSAPGKANNLPLTNSNGATGSHPQPILKPKPRQRSSDSQSSIDSSSGEEEKEKEKIAPNPIEHHDLPCGQENFYDITTAILAHVKKGLPDDSAIEPPSSATLGASLLATLADDAAQQEKEISTYLNTLSQAASKSLVTPPPFPQGLGQALEGCTQLNDANNPYNLITSDFTKLTLTPASNAEDYPPSDTELPSTANALHAEQSSSDSASNSTTPTEAKTTSPSAEPAFKNVLSRSENSLFRKPPPVTTAPQRITLHRRQVYPHSPSLSEEQRAARRHRQQQLSALTVGLTGFQAAIDLLTSTGGHRLSDQKRLSAISHLLKLRQLYAELLLNADPDNAPTSDDALQKALATAEMKLANIIQHYRNFLVAKNNAPLEFYKTFFNEQVIPVLISRFFPSALEAGTSQEACHAEAWRRLLITREELSSSRPPCSILTIIPEDLIDKPQPSAAAREEKITTPSGNYILQLEIPNNSSSDSLKQFIKEWPTRAKLPLWHAILYHRYHQNSTAHCSGRPSDSSALLTGPGLANSYMGMTVRYNARADTFSVLSETPHTAAPGRDAQSYTNVPIGDALKAESTRLAVTALCQSMAGKGPVTDISLLSPGNLPKSFRSLKRLFNKRHTNLFAQDDDPIYKLLRDEEERRNNSAEHSNDTKERRLQLFNVPVNAARHSSFLTTNDIANLTNTVLNRASTLHNRLRGKDNSIIAWDNLTQKEMRNRLQNNQNTQDTLKNQPDLLILQYIQLHMQKWHRQLTYVRKNPEKLQVKAKAEARKNHAVDLQTKMIYLRWVLTSSHTAEETGGNNNLLMIAHNVLLNQCINQLSALMDLEQEVPITPSVVHCAHGKDRTGIALSALFAASVYWEQHLGKTAHKLNWEQPFDYSHYYQVMARYLQTGTFQQISGGSAATPGCWALSEHSTFTLPKGISAETCVSAAAELNKATAKNPADPDNFLPGEALALFAKPFMTIPEPKPTINAADKNDVGSPTVSHDQAQKSQQTTPRPSLPATPTCRTPQVKNDGVVTNSGDGDKRIEEKTPVALLVQVAKASGSPHHRAANPSSYAAVAAGPSPSSQNNQRAMRGESTQRNNSQPLGLQPSSQRA